MATKLWAVTQYVGLRASAPPTTPGSYSWTLGAPGPYTVGYLDLTAQTGSDFTLTASTLAGPVSAPGISVYNGSAGRFATFTSRIVSSQVTISGDINFSTQGSVSNAAANATVRAVVWRWQPDGTISIIADGAYGSAMSTTISTYNWSVTPTETTLNPGDVITLTLYIDDAPGQNMASGYSATIRGGYTYLTSIEFAETISFNSQGYSATGTTTKLLKVDSDVTGKKKLWTDTAGTSTTYSVTTVASPNLAQWTLSTGGATVEWITPKLNPATVSGPFTLTASIGENNSAANITALVRVYKTDSVGNNPVLVGQGSDYYEFSAFLASRTFYGHMYAEVAQDERLLVRLYTISSTSAQAAGYTGNLSVETTSTTIKWPTTLTTFVGNTVTLTPCVIEIGGDSTEAYEPAAFPEATAELIVESSMTHNATTSLSVGVVSPLVTGYIPQTLDATVSLSVSVQSFKKLEGGIAPVNSTFENKIPLVVEPKVEMVIEPMDVRWAGEDPGERDVYGNTYNDIYTVWYDFVPSKTGRYAFIGTGVPGDTWAALWQDPQGNGIFSQMVFVKQGFEYTFKDADGNWQFAFTAELTAGETYYLQLGVWWPAEGSTVGCRIIFEDSPDYPLDVWDPKEPLYLSEEVETDYHAANDVRMCAVNGDTGLAVWSNKYDGSPGPTTPYGIMVRAIKTSKTGAVTLGPLTEINATRAVDEWLRIHDNPVSPAENIAAISVHTDNSSGTLHNHLVWVRVNDDLTVTTLEISDIPTQGTDTPAGNMIWTDGNGRVGTFWYIGEGDGNYMQMFRWNGSSVESGPIATTGQAWLTHFQAFSFLTNSNTFLAYFSSTTGNSNLFAYSVSDLTISYTGVTTSFTPGSSSFDASYKTRMIPGVADDTVDMVLVAYNSGIPEYGINLYVGIEYTGSAINVPAPTSNNDGYALIEGSTIEHHGASQTTNYWDDVWFSRVRVDTEYVIGYLGDDGYQHLYVVDTTWHNPSFFNSSDYGWYNDTNGAQGAYMPKTGQVLTVFSGNPTADSWLFAAATTTNKVHGLGKVYPLKLAQRDDDLVVGAQRIGYRPQNNSTIRAGWVAW